MVDVVVIGAGITGVTTAYTLLERGYEIAVVDKRRYPGMETSFANGGQLSASNAEVWNSWNTMLKAMRWLLRPDAPFLLKLNPSYHKYSWLFEFCRQIPNHRINTIQTTRLAIAAREHLFGMAEREGIKFDLERKGILHIYHDNKSFQIAAAANEMLREGGLERYPVTPQEMRQIEPALSGNYHGGFYTPSDATGDIHLFTSGLAEACARRGVQFFLNTEVTDIEASEAGVSVGLTDNASVDGRRVLPAKALVVCAGVGSRKIAATLGDRVNIYPVKGYSITVALSDDESRQAAPTVSLLDDEAKIVTSRLGAKRFRVAGTAEFSGYNKDIRADRISPLVRWCERLFPKMGTRDVVPWAGLRPMTPSMMPRVGGGRRRRVFYNTGHGHLGWTLSAATAQIVAAQVESEIDV